MKKKCDIPCCPNEPVLTYRRVHTDLDLYYKAYCQQHVTMEIVNRLMALVHESSLDFLKGI